MQVKINAIIPSTHQFHWISIFGYVSRSQPGLEIQGLGVKGRSIKEKIIYLSKKRNLKFSLKRFVICVEGLEHLDKVDTDYLELALLVAFWSMAGFLPLQRLDSCFCSAKISLDGEIDALELTQDYWQKLDAYLINKDKQTVCIGPESIVATKSIHFINVTNFLNDTIGGFSLVGQMESVLASSLK